MLSVYLNLYCLNNVVHVTFYNFSLLLQVLRTVLDKRYINVYYYYYTYCPLPGRSALVTDAEGDITLLFYFLPCTNCFAFSPSPTPKNISNGKTGRTLVCGYTFLFYFSNGRPRKKCVPSVNSAPLPVTKQLFTHAKNVCIGLEVL